MKQNVYSASDSLDIVKERLSYLARLLQFAEECEEAAKASLRVVRFLMNENPMNAEDATIQDFKDGLVAEYSDLAAAALALDLEADDTIVNGKLQRWANSLIRKEDNAV